MFLVYLLLPALISVEEYGVFSYSLSLCFIFSQPFIEFGLDPIVTKYVSRGKYQIINNAFLLRGKTTIIGIIVLFISALIFDAQFGIIAIISTYIIFFSFSNLIFAYFRGREKFIYESLLLPLFKASIIILILVFSKLILINDRYTGAIPFAISSLLLFISALIFFLKEYKTESDKDDKRIIEGISILKEGGFLFFSTLMWMIYFRIDSVMLGIMTDASDVGIYSLSYRLYEGSVIVPSAIMIVIFPKISYINKVDLQNYFHKGIVILFILSIFTFLALFFLGEIIIKHLYDIDFSQSIGVLKILSFSIFAVFPAHLSTQLLIARDKGILFLIVAIFGALLNICLNYCLIPEMRSMGAAFATVATEIMVLLISLGLSEWIIKRG